MEKKKRKYSRTDKVILGIGFTILGLFVLSIAIPIIYVVLASFMDPTVLNNQGLSFNTKDWTLDAYRRVLENEMIWRGFLNSFLYSLAFAVISVFVTLLAAYPLSKKEFVGRDFFNVIFLITMFFGGGMIPTFILINQLHMVNTVWAILIPGAFNVWNMILARTYYQSIPTELREASAIDGANEIQHFFNIMLPVCKALGYDVVAFGVMATVNLAIGQVTPPVGVNLFVAISIKIKKGLEVTLQQISRAVMPMIAASVAVLLIVTYIPATSTALPKALAKDGSYTGDQASADTGSTSSKDAGDGSDSFNTIEDYSDLDWPEMTWNFACSTTETSTWADGGRKFGELMEKATGGKVKVNVYATDQLTNGNQSEGIQALMNGDPVQISMHSNLIYSAFDPRFNVVSLPFIYDSVEDADAKFDGEAGEKMKEILSEYGLHCMGIAENGFRELTNSVREVKSVDDMKNLKVRVAGSNLLMECYKRWGADATNLNWSETYTALQQNTVEGEENPLPAIDAASVQEVQPYCSMWDAIYDCLFFCINQDIYDGLTPEQQAVVDKAGRMAVEYERYINRSGANEIMNRWEEKNGVTFTAKEDMDIDSFKEAVEGVDQWFVEELKNQGYDDGQELVDAFK